jgi:tetratricopeptide (TPR) repeat protein
MQKASDSVTEHLPLEEIRIEQIMCLDPPEEWSAGEEGAEPPLPPVLVEDNGLFMLLVHHRTVWQSKAAGKIAVRALVVRSSVHIPLAHRTVRNCLEEALLFDGLLGTGIVPNRSRLAEMLGYSRARITQVLNILKLPVSIRQRLLLADHVSEFQLRPLIKIDDEKRQLSAFRRLMADKLTGRQMALFAASEEMQEARPAGQTAGLEEMMAEPAGAEECAPQEASEEGREQVEPVHEKVEIAQTRAHQPRAVAAPAEAQPAVATAERQMYSRLGQLLDSLGTLREHDWQETALRLGATPDEMAFLDGVSFLRRGMYVRASDILTRCVAARPGNAQACFYLGRCRNLMENAPEAEENLRRACELIPDDPDFLSELAIVLEKQRRHSEASGFYRKAGVLRKSALSRTRKA